MPSSEKEKLLNDVLAAGDYAEFRKHAWSRMRREFRRHHRKTRLRWLALTASLLLVAFLWQTVAQRKTALPDQSASAPAVQRATADSLVIRSRPLNESQVVHSVPDQRIFVESSRVHTLARTVVTTPSYAPRLLDDSALLAQFPAQPAGFVWNGRGEKRFVLLTASH